MQPMNSWVLSLTRKVTAKIPLFSYRRVTCFWNRLCVLWVLALSVPLVTYYYTTSGQGVVSVSENQKVQDQNSGSLPLNNNSRDEQDKTIRDRFLEHSQRKINISFSSTSPEPSSSPATTPISSKINSTNSSSTNSLKPTPDVFTSPFIIPEGNGTESLPVDFKVKASRREMLVFRDTRASKVFARTIAYLFPCYEGNKTSFCTHSHYMKNCKHNNCETTVEWREADVLVFYPFKITEEHIIPNFTRPAKQRWVMYTPEAPCRARNFWILNTTQFVGQFNWSLTYHLDSDIPNPYGKLKRVTPAPDKNYNAIYSTKRVQAAWFVSHCRTESLRMPYVKRLQKIIAVDIFGKCGNYSCSEGSNYRMRDNTRCFPLLSRKYFYYLAFENSFCIDYVTEKFFKLFTNADVIPVVRGGADYKRYFPPGTFIDASDFDTPEALGEYLQDLSRDKGRYLKMLRKKNEYEFLAIESQACKLCEKMNRDTSVQWYPGHNMWTWFVKDQCNNPKHK